MTANGYGSTEINEVALVSGRRLLDLRREAGMSQQDVANNLAVRGIVGWHQTTVGKTETGKRTLRIDEAMALADTFGVLVEDLISDPDSASYRYRKAVALSSRYWELDAILQFLGSRIDEVKAELDKVQAGGDDDGERGEAAEQ